MDEEYDDVINDEYEETIESIQGENTRTKKGHVIFEKVNHSDRAAKFKVLSDGEVAEYVNVALEYFNNRCALSGERFEKFKGKIDRKIGTNLSAEHVVALCQGGHDIVPNLVPSVLQYNISKNGYYLLDWWEKQKDINGKPIYSPYRLLKLVNFMIKSIEAREFSQGKDIKNYRKAIMTPNEIDEFLEQIETEDELEIDNSKKKIFSETITATTLDENNKKILTQIPTIEGNMPSHSTQVKEREQIDERVMMDIFLTDAVKVLEQQLPNESELHSKLNEKLANVVGEIPFEVNVRNIILQKLEKLGLKENKYSVANDIERNMFFIDKIRTTFGEDVEEYIEKSIDSSFNSMLLNIEIDNKLKLLSSIPGILYSEIARNELKQNIELYKKYISKKVDYELIDKAYLKNILNIKQWMEKNNTEKPPRGQRKDKQGNKIIPEDEAELGVKLANIKNQLIKKYLNLQTEEEKEEYNRQHPELEKVMAIAEEIDRNNVPIKEEQLYYIRILEIKKWMEENNTTKPPRCTAKDKQGNRTIPENETQLGDSLYNIRRLLIRTYLELQTEEEKEEYKRQHPELEEVMAMVKEIDKNNVPIKENQINYIDILKIKKWMVENNTTKPPRKQRKDKQGNKTVPEDEAKLGAKLNKIRTRLIKPYLNLQTEEEKEEYKIQNPELDEVMAILAEIDKKNIPIYLQNIIEIRKWMEENNTTKTPRMQNKNKTVPEYEAQLGKKLSTIRELLINPYLKLQNEEEKKEYKRQHPELEEVMELAEEMDRNNVIIREEQTYYIKIMEIKEWMEKNKTTKPPRPQNKSKTVPEDEAQLGRNLIRIRASLIKPYLILEKEEEKEEYKRKHPELEEVMDIVEEIDKNNTPICLQNILEIRKWMEKNKTTKPPRNQNKNKTVPKDEEQLGLKLKHIRKRLIKPYLDLQTEEEKEEYKRENPELEEVMAIVEEIDKNNVPIKEEQPYYINILEIMKWMEENNTTKPPRQAKKDKYGNKIVSEVEARLGANLETIRRLLIKPYLILEKEEEKEKYKRKHPELEDVMAMIEEIDRKNPTKNKVKSTIVSKKNNGKLGENYEVEKEFEETIRQVEQNIDKEDGER